MAVVPEHCQNGVADEIAAGLSLRPVPSFEPILRAPTTSWRRPSGNSRRELMLIGRHVLQTAAGLRRPPPMRRYIGGPAGTGKSMILHAAKRVCKTNKPPEARTVQAQRTAAHDGRRK